MNTKMLQYSYSYLSASPIQAHLFRIHITRLHSASYNDEVPYKLVTHDTSVYVSVHIANVTLNSWKKASLYFNYISLSISSLGILHKGGSN
jgi:hypothetical protein